MDVAQYNPRIGFEIECVAAEEGHDEILQQMCDDLRLRRQRGADAPYTGWKRVNDSSINHSWYQTGIELVSPVMDYRDGMNTMKAVFAWMNGRKLYTNSSCGFHVGLSIDDMDQLDPVKLVSLFDEASVLAMFGREDNRYCHPIIPILEGNARYRDGRLSRSDAKEILTARSRDTKYRSINFLKLMADSPYLEFRCMGGKDYQYRYEEIELCVDHMLECMIYATQPGLMQHESDQNWERIAKSR